MTPLLRRAASLSPESDRARYGAIGLHMARDAVHLVQLDAHGGAHDGRARLGLRAAAAR